MKYLTKVLAILLGILFSCLPGNIIAQCIPACPTGQVCNTYCYDNGEVDNIAFEVCPSAGMALESDINQGSFFATLNDNLTVYSGSSGSGIGGTIVFGPMTGNVAGNTVTSLGADQCLTFVTNSNLLNVPLSCADGTELELQVCSESIAASSVSFTAPDDLCINAGVQVGLSGGIPVGGVYSGAGVTDDGNGMTYSFDPAAAGVGTHTLTYTNGGSASDDVEVFAVPTVTFTAPADLCIDAGTLTGQGGGSPSGGVYSGSGVTDDGNGLTYSFDPAAAGLGIHTITYTESGICMATATDDIEVLAACGCPAPETSHFHCGGGIETNLVVFEVCPTAGMAAQATINTGTYTIPGNTLTIYEGASGSGTSGTIVFGPSTGDLSGTVITGLGADQCLVFVHNSPSGQGCQQGLETALSVCGESIAPSLVFTAPDDICIDAGVQTGLSGGLPTGGVYSGAGVTDDGNGMTYSFDPAAAGVGVHTLTYTNGGTANDDVEVFATGSPGCVSFIALDDLCINAGVQTGLGGGTPTGGVYSGAGVTDDGNGMTYSFDPAAAGVGTHTLTYTVGGNPATDDVEVFALPSPALNITNNTVCLNAGVLLYSSTGSPTGGVYSGTGVADLGNGISFTFDPAVAGVGVHMITYTVTDANGCVGSAMDDIEVLDLVVVTFSAPADLCISSGIQTGLGGGTPTGGVYSGPGVSDDGNGMTYSFDPAAAGVGVHTLTYTFTIGNNCTSSESDDIEVIADAVISCPPTTPPTIEGCGHSDIITASSLAFSTVSVVITEAQFIAEGGTVTPPGATTSISYIDVGGGSPGNCPFTVTRTYTIETTCPGTIFCVQDWIINDSTDPVINCPPDEPSIIGCMPEDVTMESALPFSTSLAVLSTAQLIAEGGSWTDNCTPQQMIEYQDVALILDCGPITVTRTFTVTDICGNTDECDQIFTISRPAPVIVCPVNVTVECGNPTTPTSTGAATAMDACSGGNLVTSSMDAFVAGCGNTGIITRTWTATDACGNTSTCDQIITIEDTTPPTIDCPADMTVECGDPINFGMATGTDNCGSIAITFMDTSVPGCGNTEVITRTWTATDDCGNPTSCDQVVTIVDTSPPTISCPADITVQCGDPINAGTATGTDICGSVMITFADVSVPGCGNTEVITRTWTATDDCGLSNTCDQIITIIDTNPPVPPNPPGPVTVQCAEDVPAPVDLTATDACQGDITVSPTAVITPGSCANRFTMVRTWTFDDGCGNTSSVSQNITIFDDTAPTLSAMPASTTVECDAIPAPPVITATDNCASTAPVIFINEIHYDNDGGDTGEFIEVAGTAGFDLSTCQLVLYNGNGGAPYNTMTLSGMIDNEGTGFGAVDFQYPSNGIQNGSPDGMALVCGGVVIQFLSYEGTFTANGGPADGMMSVDIGVNETDDPPLMQSLQLTGTGCSSGDFAWNPPAPQSPGTLNPGQTFDLAQCQSSNDVPVIFTENSTPGACPQEQTITRIWSATDECGNNTTHTQTITVVDTTIPEFCNGPVDITVDCLSDVPAAEVLGATDNCDFSGMNGPVWINEFHYDNTGGDVGEFIEIAGVAGTDLTGYSIHTYNGANGNTYNAAMDLSGIIDNEACNRGALSFSYPVNGLQNGAPDGFALVDPDGNVVEFLSYEGSFMANDGPAMGTLSTNVGVSESGTTPVGFSLQLTGTGASSPDFAWTAPSAASPGSLNTAQIMQGNLIATLMELDEATECDGGKITRTWTVEDACGNAAVPHVQIIFVNPPPPPVITCPADQTVECIDDFVLDPNTATATSLCGSIVAIYIKNPLISGVPNCDGTIYTYIYVALDDCGRTSECEQQVLIENDPATVTVPAGGTVECFEDIDISVDDATVNGACADYNLYLVPPVLNGPNGCPGTTYTYTYRMVDACGRTVEEPVVFTNGANAGPTIEAPADITCQCLGGVSPNPGNATVTTSCTIGSTVTVAGPQIFGPVDCNGTVYRYTYTVTDDCGRTATDIQDFTVNNGPPVFENCPEDNWLVLNCEDYGGEDGTIAVIEAWIASVTASSSCGVPLTVFNNFNPNNINTCVNNGYNTVTFRATDACGRTSFCQGVYVVVDTEAPIITTEAQDHWEMCNYNTQANLDAWVQNIGGAEAFDGCSNDNISWQASPANPTISCVGSSGTTSVTVTFIVTDNCGNKTSTTATFNALPAPGVIGEDNPEQLFGDENSEIELFQNQPNPFKHETMIGFYLPEDMEATLVIYDISGKVIKQIQGDYAKGYNSLSINRSELTATGFLLYQLQTEMGSMTKRMILIE